MATATARDLERVVQRRNGEKAAPTFSRGEMERRVTALRVAMAARDIDACLFTSYHNINYYADFLYCAFGRRYGLVITGDASTTISAGIDGGQPWRRSFGDNVVYTDWRRDNYFHALERLLKGARRVGIEHDQVSVDLRRLLGEAFPQVAFVDIAETAMWMRTVKSAEEIALIEQGAAVADIGGAACVEALGTGVREHEVALASTAAMVRAFLAGVRDGTPPPVSWRDGYQALAVALAAYEASERGEPVAY